MIDVQSGVVHRMPFYDVLEMPLGPALETRTGLPVYLQHDISAWTMAEALYGASRGSQNVIQVVIDHNVGAGVITGGHVLHAGSHSGRSATPRSIPTANAVTAATTAVSKPWPALRTCWRSPSSG